MKSKIGDVGGGILRDNIEEEWSRRLEFILYNMGVKFFRQ